MQDIRLDFITDIDKKYIDMMTSIRQSFIQLDKDIQVIGNMEDAKKNGALRCLSIARTNVETACQYTIKSLCLMGEKIK